MQRKPTRSPRAFMGRNHLREQERPMRRFRDKSKFVAVILLQKRGITHPLERGGAFYRVTTGRSRDNRLLL